LIFPFRPYRLKVPAPSLGGGMLRYKPVISLTVIGPSGQVAHPTLVDSGADDIVFPIQVAGRIGVDLSAAVAGQAQGLGGSQPVGLLYSPVILLLSDGTQTCRWRAITAFTGTKLHFAILGIAGGLEHFRTTLDVQSREIILLPQPSLPAVTVP
jgi:hypothetical protein